MARDADDGRVWGRPEALDTLGRLPGRRRRSLGTLVGLAAIVAGTWVGFSGAAGGASPQQVPEPVGDETCASIGVNLDTERIPAEGVAERSVVRLSRTNPDGTSELLAPQVFVLKVTPVPEGIQMSVLVRTAVTGDGAAERINGASADGTLTAAVLYDIDPLQVVNECRGE
jgi:hypothetical protein